MNIVEYTHKVTGINTIYDLMHYVDESSLYHKLGYRTQFVFELPRGMKLVTDTHPSWRVYSFSIRKGYIHIKSIINTDVSRKTLDEQIDHMLYTLKDYIRSMGG